jgi:signal peptidase I
MPSSIPLTPGDQEYFKLGLAIETLRSCGMVRIKAWGVSMLPALWPGDLLSIQSVTPDSVVPGDIVLVLRDKQCFIHRLVRTTSENCVCFITRGDAMPDNDPPVAVPELMGRVVEARRGNRNFVPSRRISFVHAAVAWALCRSDHFRGFALRLHAARVQSWRRRRPGSDSRVRASTVPEYLVSHESN